MGFELVIPRGRIDALEKGQAAVAVPGQLRFHKADLMEVGLCAAIQDEAAVMVDVGTRRLAVRKAAEGEPASKVTLNKTRTAGCLSIGAALKLLGVTVEQCKGRYAVTKKENLLIIQLRGTGKKDGSG
jgi:hypothetical protein